MERTTRKKDRDRGRERETDASGLPKIKAPTTSSDSGSTAKSSAPSSVAKKRRIVATKFAESCQGTGEKPVANINLEAES